jgi:hypothetical protein
VNEAVSSIKDKEPEKCITKNDQEIEKSRTLKDDALTHAGNYEITFEPIGLNTSYQESLERGESTLIPSNLNDKLMNNDEFQNIPQWRRESLLTDNTNSNQLMDLRPNYSGQSHSTNRNNAQKHSNVQKIKSPNNENTNPAIGSNLAAANRLRIVQNELFVMVFDFPTPRPHFIILYKNPLMDKKKATVNDLSEGEIQQILNLIEKFKIKFDLTAENFILSFHTGYWVNFHV